MNFTEKTIKTDYIYNGKILKVRIDTVELPNSHTATREIISHMGGVAVVPIDDEGNIYMVRQFRKPFETVLLEVPAGKIDPNEKPEDCGARELKEETGLVAEQLLYLGQMYPTPGFCDEIIHMFMATKLSQQIQSPDEDEFLSVEKITLDKAVDMVMSGEIKDAKTICSILKAKNILSK